MAATIHLIRHGQAAFGAADYDELSELGREQARLLGAALAPLAGEGDIAIHGGMRRHRQTAEECLAAMPGLARAPWADERWNEFDHAQIIARYKPEYVDHARMVAELSAQANPRRAFQSLFAAAMTRWCDGGCDDDYSETWPAFQSRCMAAVQAAADAAGDAANVWVFTSGGAIAAVVQQLLEVSNAQALRLSWTLVNASVSQLHVARGGVRLSTFNGHAHLYGRGDLITYR